MTLASIRKALAPFVLGAVAAICQWIATGELDVAELRTLAAGAVMAVVVYFVPNEPPRPHPLSQVGP